MLYGFIFKIKKDIIRNMVRVIKYKGLHKIFKLSRLLMKSILYRVFQKKCPPM